MRYDIFVNSSDKDHIDLVKENFPDRKIYFPSNDTLEEHLESLKNSRAIISYVTTKPHINLTWAVRMFHQQHTNNYQQRLENIVTVVSPETSLDPYAKNVLTTMGHLESDSEVAFNKLEKYLQREDKLDWTYRNMYKQPVPWLKRFYTLQVFLIKALESLDRLRQ